MSDQSVTTSLAGAFSLYDEVFGVRARVYFLPSSPSRPFSDFVFLGYS